MACFIWNSASDAASFPMHLEGLKLFFPCMLRDYVVVSINRGTPISTPNVILIMGTPKPPYLSQAAQETMILAVAPTLNLNTSHVSTRAQHTPGALKITFHYEGYYDARLLGTRNDKTCNLKATQTISQYASPYKPPLCKQAPPHPHEAPIWLRITPTHLCSRMIFLRHLIFTYSSKYV